MRLLFIPLLLVAAAGCTDTTTPGVDATSNGTSIVLADRAEPATLNPLLGYGRQGASKIYDGLVGHRADGTLRPLLAAELPEPSVDGLTWTVKLRGDVKFSDGSAFGAEDVVATYRALLDPAIGSPVRTAFSALTAVDQPDASTVRFTLGQPHTAFPHLLVLGVLPSEGGATKDAPPIGTGPYKVAEWIKGDRLVLEANSTYFDGEPKIKKLTVVFVPDDNTRAQKMQAGDFDGAVLPPKLTTAFGNRSGFQVINHRTADYRAVTLPAANPVTGDRALRIALNYAVDRQGMVDSLLGGKGTPASTPVPDALPEFVDASAKFRYDKVEAERQLEVAGWVRGADGIRVKGGTPARFTLMYPLGDAVRAELATAFAADAKAVGVEVQLAGLSWDAITPRLGQDALLSGEGNPFDLDLMLYQDLRGQGNTQADAALEAAHKLSDPAQRAVAYKQFQRAYVVEPSMVFLAFPEHSYVVRDNWKGYLPVVDPHSHGGLAWGPWWNLQKWEPK